MADVAACVGTKEFVASTPQYLRLRQPERDTVLHPAIAYPTYAMGASLAGCRAVAYDELDAIDPADAERALCLWVNTPANPHGVLVDLGAAAEWGRRHGVPVLSDECYVEFTWVEGGRHTILEHGADGVLAVHSLSKRSNLAGARAGCYAGDAELVRFLSEVRKHAGCMVPGPVQAAAVAAWGDDAHVDAQRAVYLRRLDRLRTILAAVGVEAPLTRRRLLPLGARTQRRRVGVGGPPGHRRRGHRHARRDLRPGGRRPRPGRRRATRRSHRARRPPPRRVTDVSGRGGPEDLAS